MLKACVAPNVAGQVINVATAQRISLNLLFRTLRDLIGPDGIEPIYKPGRAGDVRDSLADLTKAQTLLAYEPVVDFTEGLRRTVEWYKVAQPAATR